MAPTTLDPAATQHESDSTRIFDEQVWDTPVWPGSSWKRHVREALAELQELPEGWDGYGAPSPKKAIIEAMEEALHALPEDLCPRPDVVPLASGAVQLEWACGERELELELETPSTIHYLKWAPAEAIEDEATLSVTDTDRIAQLVRWVFTR